MAELEPEAPKTKSLGEKLTSFPKFSLYVILAVIASLALFPSMEIPVKPSAASTDLFASLMTLPEGSTIILQSDWTNSSRGESAGAMEALLRIVMRKKLKFVIMSVGDPSAPRVARGALERINTEREAMGEPRYEKWNDFIELGYFPNAEATGNAMANNLKTAWSGRMDQSPQGPRNVFESPVLQGINRIEDVAMLINIHASDTLNRLIERIGKRTKLASMCTGVMGPETMVYYTSGQIVGVSVGLNGVVEMEALMQRGIDPYEGVEGTEAQKLSHDIKNPVLAPGRPKIEGFRPPPGKDAKAYNYARGMQYYLSLHSALSLMILAVVIGNIGTFLMRRRAS